MNEAAKAQSDLYEKWIVAHGHKYSISGYCIWDDGDNALCVSKNDFDNDLRVPSSSGLCYV